MCLGQAQPFTGIPQVSEYDSPKGFQQQMSPTLHILWRGKLRPKIAQSVNVAGLEKKGKRGWKFG